MSLSTKKIILAIPLIVFSFMLPCVANAALSPLTDTQCWTKAMCLGRTHDCDHCFKEGEGQCSAPFGRCYHPHEPIDLQIHLGSTGQVTDMAEYISLAYRYILSIGSILGVVVIIASGVIYLTAGGNPSRIGQAKEYIGGAVVGVILLFTSYLILNTLNPDLVRLKMPSISMIRPANIATTFCADVPWDEKTPTFFRADNVAENTSPTNPRTLKDPAEAISSGTGRPYAPSQLTCNWAFYSATTGETPCYGSGGCEPRDSIPTICAPDPDRNKTNWFTCQEGNFTGTIAYGNYPFDNPLQISSISLYYLCDNEPSRIRILNGVNLHEEEESPGYVLSIPSNIASVCEGTPIGGAFLLFVAEENDLLDDSWYFFLGKNACINTSGNPYSITLSSSTRDIDPTTCDPAVLKSQIEQEQSELWTAEELLDTPIRCNLRLENRSDSFPITE